MNTTFRPMWIFRLFFPLLFVVLVCIQFIEFIQDSGPILPMTLFDWFMLSLEIFILYNMLFFLSVHYEIANDEVIVRSFLFREKRLEIPKILFIEEDVMFSKFGKSGFGPDCATIHFDGGEKLTVIGLSEHYRFIQLLKGKTV